MEQLTQEQIKFIETQIASSTISSNELHNDLLDHFCCFIEEEMAKGLDFKTAYDKAYHTICPDGFDEIQQETIYLLTFKNLQSMKRMLKVTGIMSVVGVSATLPMKLLHVPGAQIILLLTAAILFFLFLPSLFTHLYKREIATSKYAFKKNLLGCIGFMLLVAFVVFKISHWPASMLILFAAIAVLNIGFFPYFFLKKYRKTETV